MRKVVAVILMALVGLLAACGPVSSLNPLFADKDVVFDPGLLGAWTVDGSDGFMLRFEKEGANGYRVIDQENDENGGAPKQTVYQARLVNLDGQRFLDVVPEHLAVQSASYQVGLAELPRASDQGSQLLRLGDGVFAQISRIASDDAISDVKVSLRKGHWIFRVETDGETLRLAALDQDWLKKAIEEGRASISNTATSDSEREIVITAKTAELQQFVLDHVDDPDAFAPSDELHRVK